VANNKSADHISEGIIVTTRTGPRMLASGSAAPSASRYLGRPGELPEDALCLGSSLRKKRERKKKGEKRTGENLRKKLSTYSPGNRNEFGMRRGRMRDRIAKAAC